MAKTIEERVTVLETHFLQLEKEMSNISHILKDHTSSLQKSNEESIALSVTLKNIQVLMDKVSSDLEELKEKPANHLDNITKGIITAIVAGLITYIFMRLGLK